VTTGSSSGARFVFSAEYRARSLRRAANRDAQGMLQISESVSPFLPTTIRRRSHKNAQERPAGAKWGRREMNGADDWVERLLADLKSASTTTWEGGKEAFRTMPNTIERVIRWHLDRVDSNLCRSYCERAIFHFERLVEQSDPYAETLRQASARLRL
jgi:hypothetical protein